MPSSSVFAKITLPNGETYEQPTGLFINGEFIPSIQGNTFEVINPATEEEITRVYEAREDDIEAAVKAAEVAFKSWSTKDAFSRGQLLNKVADLIEEHADTIAAIESMDNGKPVSQARGDVLSSGKFFRIYASWADKLFGTVINTDDDHFNFTRREPLGVCGQIIPWNFPMSMWANKIAPAIAAGNTVVLKSAETTPLSALYATNLIKEAGVPPGVVNVVSGFGKIAGEAIAIHPRIKKIAFTGSTATGRHIMKAAAESNLKKVTLELGGKSPNIVFADADIEKAIQKIIFGVYFNAGQVCVAGTRAYVHEDIYDKVLSALKVGAEGLKVGDPFAEETFQGPQNSKTQLDRILSYVEIGKKEGATLLTGGERIGSTGYFIRPTIFTDVKEDMRIVKEEIFGPVVTVSKFSTVDEVVEMANATEYGLAAAIHTQDINKAIDVSKRINSGVVWVNTYLELHPSIPFGGYNQSGIGREFGYEGIEAYTQIKSIIMAITKKDK